MQENNNSGAGIKDILDGIAEENKSKLQSAQAHVDNVKQTGLVFDDSDDTDAAFTDDIIESDSEPLEQVISKPLEFDVPEKFDESQDEIKKGEANNGQRIYTTYVPTFTGVSDNYRMVNDPRPAPIKKLEEQKESDSITEDNIDPTAELDENASVEYLNVNEISAKTVEEDTESASTVFKFHENEEPEEEGEQKASVQAEPQKEEAEQLSQESAADSTEKREYMIPDPVSESSAVAPYYNSSSPRQTLIEKTPDGIGDKDGVTSVALRTEYKAYSQRDSVKDKFLDAIMSIRVRFFASLALFFILLIGESLYAFGVDVPAILGMATVPGSMALLDVQFILGLYLITLPETVSAFKNLVKGHVCPELSLTLSFAINIAYTIIITIYSPSEYPLFGLLFAVSAIAAVGASYFRKKADFEAFKVAAQNGVKYAIDKKYTRTLERENSALDGVVEEHKSKISRIFSTLFISDFFGRVESCSENSKNTIITMGSSFGIALVTGCVAFFVPGGAVSALSAFSLVFMLAFPAISIMIKKLPYFYCEKEAYSESSAVIGEGSITDYSGVDVITFDDTDVFGAEDVTIQRIMLYGRSDNLSKALRQMSALFMNVGGPLDRLFSDSLDRKCPPADATVIEDMGIRGEIASHPVMAGNLAFMRKYGAEIPEEEMRQESLSNSTKVIYAAEDGVVYAKFYIRYSFSEEFSMLLPTLYDDGIKLLIYTRDPNITNDLMKTLTAGTDKIRVMRKYNNQEDECVTYKQISAGIVTVGDKVNAINMILLSKRYSRLQARLAVTEVIAMAVGAALAVLASFTGLWLVPSVALAAWQAGWCGVLHFISCRNFKISKDKR